MKEKTSSEFKLGEIIVPARNRMLKELGHDVSALGRKALGIVVEERPSKSLVQFLELKLTLWLPNEEIAGLAHRAEKGEAAYKNLFNEMAAPPGPEKSIEAHAHFLFFARKLVQRLEASHILSIETTFLAELEEEQNLVKQKYPARDANLPIFLLSLGIPELRVEQALEIEKELGGRLLSMRFLPAGLHKMECRLLVDFHSSL